MAKRPCDQFGEYLVRVMRIRGMNARSLALALNLSENYIYNWIHGARHVSRDVLLKVAEILGATETEHRELFRLADRRDAPDAAKHLYEQRAIDPDRILLDCLMTVDHRGPSTADAPPADSDMTRTLVDAAGWLLAFWAAHHTTKYNHHSLDWPQHLVDIGVIHRSPEHRAFTALHLIPSQMIADGLGTEVDEKSNADVIRSCADAMALTYRRWLFVDAERARTCAENLAFWEVGHGPASPIVTITFKRTRDDERCGVRDVSGKTIAIMNRTKLAWYLWSGGRSAASPNKANMPYSYPLASEFLAPYAMCELRYQVFPDGVDTKSLSYELALMELQNARDAQYIVGDDLLWLGRTGIGLTLWLTRRTEERERMEATTRSRDLKLIEKFEYETLQAVEADRADMLDRLRIMEHKARMRARELSTSIREGLDRISDQESSPASGQGRKPRKRKRSR